jgi:hypothetical protein
LFFLAKEYVQDVMLWVATPMRSLKFAAMSLRMVALIPHFHSITISRQARYRITDNGGA